MNCPQCSGSKLVMSERNGVEIDYCPDCRGVWLDRGELDKILERSKESERAIAPQREEYRGDRSEGYYRHKRKKSFLEELFD